MADAPITLEAEKLAMLALPGTDKVSIAQFVARSIRRDLPEIYVEFTRERERRLLATRRSPKDKAREGRRRGITVLASDADRRDRPLPEELLEMIYSWGRSSDPNAVLKVALAFCSLIQAPAQGYTNDNLVPSRAESAKGAHLADVPRPPGVGAVSAEQGLVGNDRHQRPGRG